VVENIAVGAIQDALFGKWEGKIVYTVGMEDVAGSSSAVTMLDGDGQVVNKFAMHEPSFRSSAPMNELQNVQINGEIVDPSNYTVSEGSTIITFKPDYVASLPNGGHEIDINSQGGTASGSFTITDEIPGDANIYEGAKSDSEGNIDVSDATEIAPEEFADYQLSNGAVFEYGDYRYQLDNALVNVSDGKGYLRLDDYLAAKGMSLERFASMMEVTEEEAYRVFDSHWEVYAIDKSKASYGEILTSIAGLPVTTMEYTFKNCTSLTDASGLVIPNSITQMTNTFDGCTNLITAPQLPNSIILMLDTFKDCTSLTTAPVIPDSVTDMALAFKNCTSLTTAPVIPSSVTNVQFLFYGCTNLTGTITINANIPNVSNSYYYRNCFDGTTQPIVLTGSCAGLDQLAATATNGNVTVQQ
jgi:hypothetical protein